MGTKRPKVTGTVAEGTQELSVHLLYSDSVVRPSMVTIHGEDGELVAVLSTVEADKLARFLQEAAGHARGHDCDVMYRPYATVPK